MGTTIAGPDVFETIRENTGRKFPVLTDPRVQNGFYFPVIKPSFTIEQGQKVFTIGSCFARNIEEELARQSVDVPTLAFETPRSEITDTGRANKALNQYNIGTILQCVRAIEGGAPDGAYFLKIDGVVDALLSTGGFAVTPNRATERREEIRKLYADEVPRADVTIITLGLIEAWYDNDAGMYLNMAPTARMVARHPERYSLVCLGYDDVLTMLRGIIETIQELGCPKIILTVSPVPLGATFTGEDCIVANATSKATLRAAAGIVCDEYENVDYFPSYEIVTSGGTRAFTKDLRHIKPVIVSQIVEYMLDHYMPNRAGQMAAGAAAV